VNSAQLHVLFTVNSMFALIVQNIELSQLTVNSTCNWTIWVFCSFPADECSVRWSDRRCEFLGIP